MGSSKGAGGNLLARSVTRIVPKSFSNTEFQVSSLHKDYRADSQRSRSSFAKLTSLHYVLNKWTEDLAEF